MLSMPRRNIWGCHTCQQTDRRHQSKRQVCKVRTYGYLSTGRAARRWPCPGGACGRPGRRPARSCRRATAPWRSPARPADPRPCTPCAHQSAALCRPRCWPESPPCKPECRCQRLLIVSRSSQLLHIHAPHAHIKAPHCAVHAAGQDLRPACQLSAVKMTSRSCPY